MTIRLLCIANPSAYRGAATDIPLSYARLASHPDVELFHTNTFSMMDVGEAIEAVRVPEGFEPEEFFSLERARKVSLRPHELDVAFCRTLKPFPAGYLLALQRRASGLRFVNDPFGIDRQLQPDFVLDAAARWMPTSLMPTSARELADFLSEHETVVAKRANSCGGRGVFRVSSEQGLSTDNVLEGTRSFESIEALHQMLSAGGTIPFLLMRYLPGVVHGERRVIVVDGEIYGAYLRRSTTGHWVQNLTMGGTPEPTKVTERERELVGATSSVYRSHGIHVLGYDLLQDDHDSWKVSEINAGNVGGLFRLERLGVPGVAHRFVTWLGTKYGV